MFQGTGLDTIADFVSGTDKFEISATGFGSGLVAGASASLIIAPDAASASNSGSNGYFIFDNVGPDLGTLYFDPTGGGGSDAIALAKGLTSLQASDFLLV